ncbi:hypothetical protein [Ideonella paludis]|uniref:Uncharacterized protein n=1 Tax=Ideonella paludis TaxID=1233411 RepID=A0ABS5DU50_9BURK|nr:hypothetical protein [Ideonella paludis]MBQ0934663.1 hypothetical protein [Ideonella paludis]
MTNTTTANTAWGFWGTMGHQADAAWPLACEAIAKACDERLEDVRDFLDSRHGRHFADGVNDRINNGASLQAAIDATTAQWMAWKIDRRTAKHYGIPAGMPYLTGFVVQLASQAA